MRQFSTSVILRQLAGKKNNELVDNNEELIVSKQIKTDSTNDFLPESPSHLSGTEYGKALNYILGPTLSDELTPMDK